MQRKISQQPGFLFRKYYLSHIAVTFTGGKIYRVTVNNHNLAGRNGAFPMTAANQCLDPGQQLFHIKGLHQVIIGTDI